ncbi:MAG: sigma-70 family RNA polymerase sigma factor [Myxococcota bacterium]
MMKPNSAFHSLPEPYVSRLGDSQPLDRQGEIRAGQRIEEAYEALLEVVLEAGLRLPEVAEIRRLLKEGEPVESVVRTGEPTDERARRRLVRATATVLRLERELEELQRALRASSRRLSQRKRRALHAEMDETLVQRTEVVQRMALSRDWVERILARVEGSLVVALGLAPEPELSDAQRAEAVGRARQELGRPVQTLKAVHRRLEAGREELAQAKAELTEANLRLVVLFARKHAGRGVPLSDLVQEGNLALMRAVDKFDHRVGTRFSTYAAWWIRQALTRAVIGQASDVRLSVHTSDSVRRTLQVASRLSHKLGREASADEIAGEMGRSTEQVRQVLESHPRTVSMQAPLGDEGDRHVGDLLKDEESVAVDEAVAHAAECARAVHLLEGLDPREQHILRRRFGLGSDGGEDRTLQEIGEELGLSRERVRQIESEALDKLRKAIAEAASGRLESAA